MFASRDRREGHETGVDVAFTDRWGGGSVGPHASLDLSGQPGGAPAAAHAVTERNWSLLAEAFGVTAFTVMRQVHGAEVVTVREGPAAVPVCDALVTSTPGVALCVRAADCVPVVLADVTAGVAGVAHVGRRGVVAGIVAETLQAMRMLGATDTEAWIGPHVCGGCYEVPAALRDEVSRVEPTAFCCTTWGTPSLDIGSAVVAQLRRDGCAPVNEIPACTRESPDLFSYRRQGAASGRQGAIVVLRRLDPGQWRDD